MRKNVKEEELSKKLDQLSKRLKGRLGSDDIVRAIRSSRDER